MVNSSIDNSVSDTIKRSGKISLTKNIALPERNIEVTIVATNFENSHVKNTTCVCPKYGHFKQQPCDFHMDKENYPKNNIIYINQGYLTIKDNRRLFYADYFLLGQVIESINPPADIRNSVRSSFIGPNTICNWGNFSACIVHWIFTCQVG